LAGVPAGRTYAAGKARFTRKSGSGSLRWKVTVLAGGSIAIPLVSRQVAGRRLQASAPTTSQKESRVNGERILKPRSIDQRTSWGVTTWPVE
jgi:hypothetical protein